MPSPSRNAPLQPQGHDSRDRRHSNASGPQTQRSLAVPMQTACMLASSRRARQWSWTFEMANSSGTPLASLARPGGNSNDPYAVLVYEARNMEGLGVASSSDNANADLFLGYGWLTLLLSMFTRRRSTAA